MDATWTSVPIARIEDLRMGNGTRQWLEETASGVGSFKDEQGIEAYDTFVPTPWLRLTANLQWVNPASGANPSVWLGGVRMRVAFRPGRCKES